ncbi:MAG: Nif3-like dinuclear metal center hexameric protein [Candidatus Omnitrophica bacterium]|nr:Nif3-like dinuclear metal center hexameric protein [Candidatus Omnitrophota bacterium]
MQIQECIRRIEHAVPPDWALPDDPIGLQAGNPRQDVQRVYVGLEVSTDFLKKAVKKQADMLLVHHPLIFRPLKRLMEDNPVQRLVREIIRKDLALYAAHTNFDLHPEGMAKVWAKKLGGITMHPLAEKPQERRLKLVTFTPPEYADRIRTALSQAGAGEIGDYSLCSFSLEGQGTFLGSEHANPFIGASGALERVQENRLEMILPERAKWSVVKALYEAHPYEEPAYDLYVQDQFRDLRQALWIVEFETKLSWSEFLQRIQSSLPQWAPAAVVCPDRKRRIKRIALSTGSGSSFIPMVCSLKVDAYVTGEIGYHPSWEARESGLNVVAVGHDWSESFFAEAIIPVVRKYCPEIEWIAER